MKSGVQRSKNALKTNNSVLKVRFWTAYWKLCIVCVLDHPSTFANELRSLAKTQKSRGPSSDSWKISMLLGSVAEIWVVP